MRDDLHVLTGSYALDAISDAEREEFERHLQHCQACAAEVRGMRETAVRLARARAVAPPARMEQRVLAATYRTRQLPPLPRDQIRATRRFPAFPRRLAVLAAAASTRCSIRVGGATARTRSTARRWAMVSTQAAALPRSGSYREAVRQTSSRTSCATSSDWAGSRSTCRTSP